jgi:hypothetical protein
MDQSYQELIERTGAKEDSGKLCGLGVGGGYASLTPQPIVES